jgi:hypothetical protein
VDNPLYEARRYPGWNVPTTQTLDPSTTDIDGALQDPTFYDPPGGVGYQNDIQDNVHGTVHCTVIDCPVTDMGAVGYSANDPVFWAHHANIDRMWDCWTSLGNANPTDSPYLTQTFSYVDPNGNLATNAVADLSNGNIQLNYVYEQASNCARGSVVSLKAPAAPAQAALTPEALATARQTLAAPAVLGNVKAHAINAAVTRKRLPIAGGAALATPRALALRGHAALPVRTHLVLRDIRFAAHPGTQFKVILERSDDRTKRVQVGTLSFFVSTVTAKGHENHAPATPMNRSFDVTNQLRQLAGPKADLADVQVVFEATTGRLGSTAKARFSAKSKLTVGEIELRVTARQ